MKKAFFVLKKQSLKPDNSIKSARRIYLREMMITFKNMAFEI